MKDIVSILIIVCLIAVSLAGLAGARDVKFEVNLDKQEIAIGETAQLGLTFYGIQRMPAPDLGNIDGIEVHYLGPSAMMTVINGKVSNSITHMYSILPLKTGKFQLGPFSFNYKGDSYASSIVFLEVVGERRARSQIKEDAATKEFDLGDRLFLTLDAGKAKAYVNELIPVTVKLYVNRLNLSDIQLPTFGQEGFSKVEFKEPKQYREEVGGVLYDVLEFKTSIFGTRPGDYKLGPAKVKCNLVIKKSVRASAPSSTDDFFDDPRRRDSFFEDFFTRYERYPKELESEEAPLKILPLPSAGKPADFSGAVGDYQFIFNVSPKKIKVGDPITVTMDINGTGNFNTVLIPRLENVDGFKMYEPQVKTEGNSKTFVQVLIPETDQLTYVPKATFSYFDTIRGSYKTIEQGPIPIEVEKGKEEPPAQVIGMAPLSSGAEREEFKRDIIYIKESPGVLLKKGDRFYRSSMSRIFIILPFIFFLSLCVIHAKNDGLRRNTKYARRLKALKNAKRSLKVLRRSLKADDPKIFYEAVFKTLQGYLGDRLDVPSGGITTGIADSLLTEKEVDLKMVRKVEGLFNICDQARFALSKVEDYKMKDDIRELEEIIKYFERVKL